MKTTALEAEACKANANSAVPGASFDLSPWYLTLPTGVQGDPEDIFQPALDTFVQEPYFHVNAECKLVFRAHAGGVTTSGSSYPRSELREMESDGVTKAAWSTATGTHTMLTTVAVVHTPVVKADLVVNQIHDAEDDIVLIRLTGAELYVQGSKLDPNTGKPIKGESVKYKTLETNYVLGTEFQTKIQRRRPRSLRREPVQPHFGDARVAGARRRYLKASTPPAACAAKSFAARTSPRVMTE